MNVSPSSDTANPLPGEPRLATVSRKAFVHRTAVAGFALAMIGGLAACGNNDAETLTADSAQTSASAEVVAGSDTTAVEATETTAAESGAADFQGTMEVSFTYEASSDGGGGGRGGRGGVKNPYIAVWVEDGSGNLVDTISVWFQPGKGEKWINDLRQWYSASDGAADTSMSGATKVAGTYTVAWDGTDLDGNAVPTGDYTIFVEAAREHGPYSLTSADFTLGDGAAVTLPDDGELMGVSAQFV